MWKQLSPLPILIQESFSVVVTVALGLVSLFLTSWDFCPHHYLCGDNGVKQTNQPTTQNQRL